MKLYVRSLESLSRDELIEAVNRLQTSSSMRVGQFTLKPGRMAGQVWIERENGEGGDFPVIQLEAILRDYFNRNF